MGDLKLFKTKGLFKEMTKFFGEEANLKNYKHLTGFFVVIFIFFAIPLTVYLSRNFEQVTTRAKAAVIPGSVPGCQFQKADIANFNVAFCDTFDQPMGTGNRSGDLNGDVWGVSRITQDENPAGGASNAWSPTAENLCGTTVTVQPERDIRICNGRMVEAINDDGVVAYLAAYPKQPFDIAGRTGTVTFDVTADSSGPHAAWPAFAYTDQPVPTPSSNHAAVSTYARNSFGFALAANCNGAAATGLDEVWATSNYVLRDFSPTIVNSCVSYTPGVPSHFEVRISTSNVEVWMTDATGTLKELGYVDNAGLTLTRGLIWIGDMHYNACKFDNQCVHTFVWDNVGFDGPVLPRDDANDVLDALVPNGSRLDLGWGAPDTTSAIPLSLTVPNVQQSRINQATGAIITLNFFPESQTTLKYRLNNNAWQSQPWPFPDTNTFAWRTLALPIPLSQVVAGSNKIDIEASGAATTIANVDLILVAGAGIPTCLTLRIALVHNPHRRLRLTLRLSTNHQPEGV